ncbi:MAG: ATP-binding protein [Hyphomicrobiaceae bacterium]|nr:MAG: ATP-binding protein [Hyphomicrobiaceae bacterium]
MNETATATIEKPNPSQRRNLPPIATGATLERVSPKLRNSLAAMIERGGFPLMLVGDPGVGKTMAAGLMYQQRPIREMAAWFSARTLLREIALARCGEERLVGILRQDGTPKRVEHPHAWHQIERADFLVIDDIGTRDLSVAQSEILAEILDVRGKRPTVYTCNHDEARLKQFMDHRIVSRLFSGTVVIMAGPDQRALGARYFDERR